MNIKTRFQIFFLLGIVFNISIISYAQTTSPAIEKSQQKIIYKGEIFYIHKVVKGNTLYSICKAYEVSKDDIEMANQAAVLDPLSIGQTLRIPAVSKTGYIYEGNESSF